MVFYPEFQEKVDVLSLFRASAYALLWHDLCIRMIWHECCKAANYPVITRIYVVGTHLAWGVTVALGGAPLSVRALPPAHFGHLPKSLKVACFWKFQNPGNVECFENPPKRGMKKKGARRLLFGAIKQAVLDQ